MVPFLVQIHQMMPVTVRQLLQAMVLIIEQCMYGGMCHNVSQGFKIPTISLQTLITYWFLGSKHPRVPPLRFIKAYNFTNKKHIGVKISQMKKDNEACNKGSRISKFRRFEWNWF